MKEEMELLWLGFMLVSSSHGKHNSWSHIELKGWEHKLSLHERKASGKGVGREDLGLADFGTV